MKRVLAPKLPRAGQPVELPKSEANHAVQVLRLRNGATVEVMDGQGGSIHAQLSIRGDRVFVQVTEGASATQKTSRSVVPICLELAILKGDAMEWAIEKAVELGVTSLQPLITTHTVVQLDRKGPEAFRERWQKIADQALKQCGRLERMEILLPAQLEKVVTTVPAQAVRLWFDESTKDESSFLMDWIQGEQNIQGTHLLIGPEGGWSQLEKDLLSRSETQRLSLGPLVLRAETAAVFSISLLAGHFRSTL